MLINMLHVFQHAGSQEFGSFMEFVESVIGEGFVAYLRGIMQRVITEIIAIASDSPDWGGGPTLPQASQDQKSSHVNP